MSCGQTLNPTQKANYDPSKAFDEANMTSLLCFMIWAQNTSPWWPLGE